MKHFGSDINRSDRISYSSQDQFPSFVSPTVQQWHSGQRDKDSPTIDLRIICILHLLAARTTAFWLVDVCSHGTACRCRHKPIFSNLLILRHFWITHPSYTMVLSDISSFPLILSSLTPRILYTSHKSNLLSTIQRSLPWNRRHRLQ